MCGIAGTLVFDHGRFTVTAEGLARMRDTMRSRGPDGEGLWLAPDGRVGLAHRRLSIIDLSAAAGQPMCNEDGSLWVVFNGEIYNHAELRRELAATGRHRWRTDHSDTEVILHAFEEWGIECVRRFRGMFAIGLWDATQRKLWLVRDRIGIKPLYYSIHHGRLVFASEIKALLEDPEQDRKVDETAFFHYLSFLTAPAPLTLFEGIRKLPAGTWMKVSADGGVETRQYWDVWDEVRPRRGVPEEDAAAELLTELRTAVALRKVSDVPVGVFLSGGVDSSANAALFAEGENQVVKTFTIGYRGDHASYTNETGYARRVAERIGAEHHELLLTQDDLIGFLPTMIELQDEPIADPVCVPVYFVSKLAKEHGVTVCQLGEGADELFGGYSDWPVRIAIQRMAAAAGGRALCGVASAALAVSPRRDSQVCEWFARGAAGRPVFWSGAEAFSDRRKRRLLAPRLRDAFKARSSWEVVEPVHRRFRERAWDTSPLHWMTYADLNLRLPELLLMRVDKMSMGVSLEGRVPFLDHKFVELALSLPADAKLKGRQLKYLLKKAVRGVVPDDILRRPKQGFGVPVHEWFLDRLGTQARAQLAAFCRETDYLDGAEVERLFAQRRGAAIWYLLNFALWWRRYIKRETIGVP